MSLLRARWCFVPALLFIVLIVTIVPAQTPPPTTLMITSTSVPTVIQNRAYSTTITATGGTPPYTWSIASGALPVGLTLNPSTGNVAGTVATIGNSAATIKVTDSSSPKQSNQKSFTFKVVAPLSITTTSLPAGTVGVPYTTTVVATGGSLPLTWSISSGTLPAGLTLATTTGKISGTPTTAGASTFTMKVTDISSPQMSATRSFTISIQSGASLQITTASLPGATVGIGYSATLTATGGKVPYTWSISVGTLPAGLRLTPSTGVISGTPTTTGTSSFTVKVTDSSTPRLTATKPLSITVGLQGGLIITTTSLPGGSEGRAYSATVVANGGTQPYTWSISIGSLPPGLSLGASTGTISGTPTTPGTYAFTIQVVDSSTPQLSATQPLTIIISGLSITTTSLANATVGTPYGATLLASGGTLPYTWAISVGSLPTGLTLNTTTGFISGNPTTTGTFTFTAQVTDSSTPQLIATQPLSIMVNASALTVTSAAPPVGTLGAIYGFTFSASGGTPPYNWSINSGALPAGIILTPLTGVIAGIPTLQQTANFTIQVTDSASQIASQPDSIQTFTPLPPPAKILLGIQVQPPAPNLTVGGAQQLTATAIFSDGSIQDMTNSAIWSSSGTGIASINTTGLATGVAPGTVTITATASAVTGYTLLSVGPALIGSANFYVATNGNDTWSGMLPAPNGNGDGPFATLDRARQAVQGHPGFVVQIENGTYFLPAPVNFTSADSGTAAAPIVYENYPGATPIISGGIKVTGWTNTSGSAWKASLSAHLYPNLTNFESLFYMPAGATDATRRFRPRLAATGNTCTVSGFLCNALTNPVISSTMTTGCDVQTSSGWVCFDQFRFNAGDIASIGYHGMGLGDVEILDFEKWTMARMRLMSVDSANNIAHLTGLTYQDPINNGFLPGHRYLIENVLESLNKTASGQWYLDRCPGCANTVMTPATVWTLTYVAQAGENPSLDTVIVPQRSQLLIGSGASNLVFQGITFSHDNWIPSAAGLGDQAGMPGVTAAVSFLNSQNVIFNACTFSHTQGWGVEFARTGTTGTSGSNQVVNSELYDLGAGGIRIGRLGSSIDTDANSPQFNLIENNVVVGGGRIQPTGQGAGIWVGNAHHNVIVHNDVSDFYNGAIGIGANLNISNGIGFGHDNITAYNHLYTLGQGVTSDMGGIHYATSATTGNMAFNNVIHDINYDYQDSDGYGASGVYFDQGTSNVIATNNLAYRLQGSGAFNNLSDAFTDIFPQNNLITNNIFALTGVVADRGGANPNSFSYIRNIAYFDMGALQSGNWSCVDVLGVVDCPLWFFFDSNDYWNPTGTALRFITTNPSASYTLSTWQPLGEDVHSINQDPLFTDPNNINDPPADGFTLQTGSPAFTILNFVNFDPTQAGRSNPVLIPPTLVCGGVNTTGACPAFPLQLLDPLTGY